jgi:hypothetical protein
VGTTRYYYDAPGQLLSEGGLWADDTVSFSYNHRLRTSLSLLAPNADPRIQACGYDAAKRLITTASPAASFSCAYDALRSTLPTLLTLPNGVLNSHTYGYNVGNQRIALTSTLGDYHLYTCDNLGQLTTALGMEPGGSPSRLNERSSYPYDAAGNLRYRTNYKQLVETFNVNSLNELTTVTQAPPRLLTIAGTTTSPATNVTVSGTGLCPSAAVRYADATWALLTGICCLRARLCWALRG